MIIPRVDTQGQPIDPRKMQEHFDDFYEVIFEELSKFGEIETLNVCCWTCACHEISASIGLQAPRPPAYSLRPLVCPEISITCHIQPARPPRALPTATAPSRILPRLHRAGGKCRSASWLMVNSTVRYRRSRVKVLDGLGMGIGKTVWVTLRAALVGQDG